MTPLPAINLTASGILPNVDLVPPEAVPLPSTGIEMPSELGRTQGAAATQPVGSSSDSFASLLGRLVSDVNSEQKISAQTVEALQSGQNVPLHQAVISMEEANVSFQLMVEVRNRLLAAYQEIMQMQV
jgi:flagellar hook-basal body complex protein FliE